MILYLTYDIIRLYVTYDIIRTMLNVTYDFVRTIVYIRYRTWHVMSYVLYHVSHMMSHVIIWYHTSANRTYDSVCNIHTILYAPYVLYHIFCQQYLVRYVLNQSYNVVCYDIVHYFYWVRPSWCTQWNTVHDSIQWFMTAWVKYMQLVWHRHTKVQAWWCLLFPCIILFQVRPFPPPAGQRRLGRACLGSGGRGWVHCPPGTACAGSSTLQPSLQCYTDVVVSIVFSELFT